MLYYIIVLYVTLLSSYILYHMILYYDIILCTAEIPEAPARVGRHYVYNILFSLSLYIYI